MDKKKTFARQTDTRTLDDLSALLCGPPIQETDGIDCESILASPLMRAALSQHRPLGKRS